jgi:hypothetical protein
MLSALDYKSSMGHLLVSRVSGYQVGRHGGGPRYVERAVKPIFEVDKVQFSGEGGSEGVETGVC